MFLARLRGAARLFICLLIKKILRMQKKKSEREDKKASGFGGRSSSSPSPLRVDYSALNGL
jgi:hypothetical protein